MLGQLGNRVQHALRAYTARDRRALVQAAETFRDNPELDIAEAIRDVGTGEAVTSMLERKGVPGMAQQTLIRPPSSRLGPLSEEERATLVSASPLSGKYDTVVDRESAFERLRARAEAAADQGTASERAAESAAPADREFNAARRYSGGRVSRSSAFGTRSSRSRSDSVGQAFAKSFARQLGTQAGKAVLRGVLGGLFRGR